MCGIAGLINFADAADRIARMVGGLRHRGPDEAGEAASGRCRLGHARLSIIDLSTGRQPLSNEDGSVLLVCNGEIYNFRELRAGLEARGHRFKTNSDNEVIVHLYEERGPECVAELDGMFAFGLWDAKAERLVLARDRLGEKPLVYWAADGRLAFASELAGLLEAGAPRVLNAEALHHYLSYLVVPFPLTIYKDVLKLPPAHRLVWERGETRVERYWAVAPQPVDMPFDEAKAELRAAVENAVRTRLVADVPLGAFLSGGVDSSIVVGLMSRLCGEVRTFSIGFGDPAYDELGFARIAAAKFGTKHTEFTVTPDAVAVLPLLARRYGEPFADPSAVPTYYLAQMTAPQVKVALTGDGADEAFGGYPRHLAARACGKFDRHMPSSFGRLIGMLGSALPRGRDRKDIRTRARLLLGAMNLAPARRHAAWLAYAAEADKQELYNPSFLAAVASADSSTLFDAAYAGAADGDAATAAMFADLMWYLPNDPLVKMDIATMASGLETRAPLLDHKVIELAFRIPSRHKLGRTRGKRILREAFADLLPEEILSRGKMGFGVPIARWLRTELAPFARDTLLQSGTILRDVFDLPRVERMLDEHVSGRADRAYPIWTLLCFELWAREFNPTLPS